ncbi:MAG: polymer-forming cytoskeletal protein [Ignavibacteria bacterium]
METQSRHDLKINGAGNTAGGKFNDVIINGVGDINGDVECINFKANGASSIIGNLNSKAAKINGSTSIRGDLTSDELKVNGSAEINGAIEVKESKINGEVKLNGNMKAESVELHGWMKISGDCNAESFVSSGGFSITGMLNADDIEIKLHGPCKAKEIGGEKISVKKGNEFTLKKIIKSIFTSWDLNGKLSADLIEGDDIELEATKAKIVRGKNVTIGSDCEIELVEYKNSFNQTSKDGVKENKKI